MSHLSQTDAMFFAMMSLLFVVGLKIDAWQQSRIHVRVPSRRAR